MAQIDYRQGLTVDAERVWLVLRDFGFFLEWATGGAGSCELEGEGVGMCRHLNIPGMGEVSERLEALDEVSRSIEYSLVKPGPNGMRSYHARVQVLAVKSNHCELVWHGEFEVLAEHQPQEVGESLQGAYQAMTAGMKTFCKQGA